MLFLSFKNDLANFSLVAFVYYLLVAVQRKGRLLTISKVEGRLQLIRQREVKNDFTPDPLILLAYVFIKRFNSCTLKKLAI